MTPLEFGADLPCPKCKLTGEVPAPPMSKADTAYRTRENARRARAKVDPLPRPPRTVPCPSCGGLGVLRRPGAGPRRSGIDVQ